MKVANSEDNLSSVELSHPFIKASLLLKKIEQLPALMVAHNEEYLLVDLECIFYGDQEGCSA